MNGNLMPEELSLEDFIAYVNREMPAAALPLLLK